MARTWREAQLLRQPSELVPALPNPEWLFSGAYTAKARLVPFVAEEVVETEYDPTRYQETLFVLPSSEALVMEAIRALRDLC